MATLSAILAGNNARRHLGQGANFRSRALGRCEKKNDAHADFCRYLCSQLHPAERAATLWSKLCLSSLSSYYHWRLPSKSQIKPELRIYSLLPQAPNLLRSKVWGNLGQKTRQHPNASVVPANVVFILCRSKNGNVHCRLSICNVLQMKTSENVK